MQITVTPQELNDLTHRRVAAPYTKKDWWSGIRSKYGIPAGLSVKVGMETGLIRNKNTSVPIEVPAYVPAETAMRADEVVSADFDHGVELGYGFINDNNKVITFVGDDAINAAFDSDERPAGRAILEVVVTQAD